MNIYHVIERLTWKKAKQGTLYEGDTLKINGYIHCCLSEQIESVLLNWFKGKHDLVILEINPGKLNSPIIYESLDSSLETFPHVYGPINLDAVVNEKSIKEFK